MKCMNMMDDHIIIKYALAIAFFKEKCSLYVFRPDTSFVINLGFDCYRDSFKGLVKYLLEPN